MIVFWFRKILGRWARAITLVALLLTALNSHSQDLSLLYADLQPTVVTVFSKSATSGDVALGSGVVISETGQIITASHVVHTASDVRVEFSNGQRSVAEVVVSVPSADLALLQLRNVPQNLAFAPLGDSDELQIGNQIMIVGAPFGLKHSLSVGYVSGRQEHNLITSGTLTDVIQTDAAVNQGNSGGPMFDIDGRVVGIISSIWSRGGGSDGIGFAISVNTARKILLESPSFWTGFDAIFLGPKFAEVLNVPNGSGLLVQHVVEDSLAGRLGLRAGSVPVRMFDRQIFLGGDIVLSILGNSCDDGHDYLQIQSELARIPEGTTFSMEIIRAGKRVTLSGVMSTKFSVASSLER